MSDLDALHALRAREIDAARKGDVDALLALRTEDGWRYAVHMWSDNRG